MNIHTYQQQTWEETFDQCPYVVQGQKKQSVNMCYT